MKFFIVISILFFSCKSTPTAFVHQKNDTIKTLCAFYTADSQKIVDIVYRISFDSVTVDSLLKVKALRCNAYFLPTLVIKKDSTGKNEVDSMGKPIKQTFYIRGNVFWDAKINIDSLLKK